MLLKYPAVSLTASTPPHLFEKAVKDASDFLPSLFTCSLAKVVCCIFPFCDPSLFLHAGPFMVVLFAKLENMLQNSLYVNILLTGIVAQLACYPQPLLRSFLLNTNMVFQPSVKSLIQVHYTMQNL